MTAHEAEAIALSRGVGSRSHGLAMEGLRLQAVGPRPCGWPGARIRSRQDSQPHRIPSTGRKPTRS